MTKDMSNHGNRLVGTFLMGISLAMFVLGTIYTITSNINLSWVGFGVVYAISLLGILGNRKLKHKFNMDSEVKVIKPISLIILAIGLILSFAIGTNFGERNLILSILIVVGIHFIPFQVKCSYVLAILTITNGIIGMFLPSMSVCTFIFIDGAVKLIIGIWLCFKNKKSQFEGAQYKSTPHK